ncbi:hypothetical protein DY000_02038515 [Brassica cretica]|uniref:HTH araC/xylS-type domain-containing protein n=1 Tax=Brassica cretica TaxID=69181 RepID=A0ABQ7BNA1_BRACR|nr:hypothetical protein DY000_02038515 [Brassica cretica]
MQAVTELFGVSPENFKSEVSSTGSGESRSLENPSRRRRVAQWVLWFGLYFLVHGGALLPSTGGDVEPVFSQHWTCFRLSGYEVRCLSTTTTTMHELAPYYKEGAYEISFLNITGFRDFPLGDLPMIHVLRYTSEYVFVPLTVGGGIRDFTDATGSTGGGFSSIFSSMNPRHWKL